MDVRWPSYTGMSLRPNRSSRCNAFLVAVGVRTLPNRDVRPMTSISGERSASRIANESSTPGSVSMITLRRGAAGAAVSAIPSEPFSWR